MFIYFIPTHSQFTCPETEAVLPYAWEKSGSHGPFCPNSPLGRGVVCGRRSIPLQMVQFGSEDQWRKIPGKEAYIKQIGEPSPDLLCRKQQDLLDGFAVELADGKQWIVPRALAWHTLTQPVLILPRRDKLGEDGQWGPGDVLPQYKGLWAAVEKIISNSKDMTYSDEVNSVVTALSVNYYVDAIECDMLGILSVQHRASVWSAVMDTIGYEELKKKAECDGLSTASGETEGI